MPRADDEGRDILRAFFAAELGASAREAAAGVVRALRRERGGDAVRWVRPENLHVTLRFLGSVARAAIPPLVRAVSREAARLAPFRLALGELHGFPSPRRPRVVALAVEPAEPLAALAAALERGVVAAGLAPEPRPFRAHLSLGRVRGRWSPVTVPVTARGEAFDVTEAVLFRSELGPGGSRYTPLERIPLGAGAPGAGSPHP